MPDDRPYGPRARSSAALARTHKTDIDAAWNAVKDAERPRIHTFISTSRHPHRAPDADRSRRRQGPGESRRRRWLGPIATTSSSRRWTRPRSDFEFTAEVLADRASTPGRPRDQRPRTRSATRPPRSTRRTCGGASTRWSRTWHKVETLGPLPQRSRAWPSPTPTPGCTAGCAPDRVRRSTAWASAPANCSLEEIVMLIKVREDAHRLHHRHQHA